MHDIIEDKRGLEERIKNLEDTLDSIKKAIIRQNNVILRLSEKVVESLNSQKDLKNSFFLASTGNKGVNQSINNQSLNIKEKSLDNKDLSPKINNLEASTGNKGVKEPLTHTPNSFEKDQFSGFREFKEQLNHIFKKLSRQELKTFLTIYQIEEEGLNPTYKAISERMELSEHCIRAHVCSLVKKEAPIKKDKLNNRLTLIFIKKDFKTLNLKNKLAEIFYKTDPDQTTLF